MEILAGGRVRAGLCRSLDPRTAGGVKSPRVVVLVVVCEGVFEFVFEGDSGPAAGTDRVHR